MYNFLPFLPHARDVHGIMVNVAMPAVAGELLEKLGSSGAPLAEGLLLRLGEMCAGASDAAEEGADEASDKVSLAAQNALGQGIRSMGPSTVLAVLPLGLVEVLCSFIHIYMHSQFLTLILILTNPHLHILMSRATRPRTYSPSLTVTLTLQDSLQQNMLCMRA